MYSCNSKASEYIQEFTNYPRHILEFGNSNSTERGLHPTQKPVDLLEYLIKTYTNKGETVLVLLWDQAQQAWRVSIQGVSLSDLS